MTTAEVLLVGVLLLFGAGVYGLLIVRHHIQQIIALQILVKSASLALVTAGYVRGEPALGQSLALTVIAVDTFVAAVALALAIQLQRSREVSHEC